MRPIFASAVEVLVWLGPAADDSDKAMDVIGEIGEEFLGFDFSLSLPKYTLLERCEEVLSSRIWDDENPTDDQGKSLSSFLQKLSGSWTNRSQHFQCVRRAPCGIVHGGQESGSCKNSSSLRRLALSAVLAV
jgi:hypothetical protein